MGTTNAFKRGDNMVYGGYLVVDEYGGMKLTRRRPALAARDVLVGLEVTVPMAVFRKPQLKASVVVPPQAGVTDQQAIQAVVDVVQAGCAFEVEVTAG